MPFTRAEWIWMNGRIAPAGECQTHVAAHALHYGTGVFEGLRCYATAEGPAVFRLADHLHRLYASADVYGLEIPYRLDELAEAIGEVIRRNGFEQCYIRPICFAGAETLGMRARCPIETAILAWPDLAHSTPEGKIRGIRATVSPWIKIHSCMMPTTAKACGQYLNSRLAVREAARRGYDEALMLNTDGQLAEASVANIFLVQGGVLRTNDASASILPGITQDTVVTIAGSLGYRVEIGALSRADLSAADEVFLTGTAAEIVPIREVDGTPVGLGEPGPVTTHLQRTYAAVTRGQEPKFRSWLSWVVPSPPVAAVQR